jgi:hypothetical protein
VERMSDFERGRVKVLLWSEWVVLREYKILREEEWK